MPARSGASPAAPEATAAAGGPRDRLWRLAYRTAHALLRLWWFVRRPPAEGVAVALWAGERLLVVRSSYRVALDLPGGGRARGEDPRRGAARELLEETGIAAPLGELGPPRRLRFVQHHRPVATTVFAWRPRDPPRPMVDGREIVWAGYRTPDELARQPLSGCLLAYLATLEGSAPPHPTSDRQTSPGHTPTERSDVGWGCS